VQLGGVMLNDDEYLYKKAGGRITPAQADP
jgi:hypothetical protein